MYDKRISGVPSLNTSTSSIVQLAPRLSTDKRESRDRSRSLHNLPELTADGTLPLLKPRPIAAPRSPARVVRHTSLSKVLPAKVRDKEPLPKYAKDFGPVHPSGSTLHGVNGA